MTKICITYANIRCLVNGCDNETDPIYDQPWLNMTIPLDDKGKFDRCHRYDVNWTDVDQCLVGSSVLQNVTCDQWVFDTSIFEDTVVTEVSNFFFNVLNFKVN